MKEKIKKYIGEFLTIIGVGISAFGFFSFKYDPVGFRRFGLSLAPEQQNIAIAYFYPFWAIMMLVFGFMLIVAGILIMKNKSIK